MLLNILNKDNLLKFGEYKFLAVKESKKCMLDSNIEDHRLLNYEFDKAFIHIGEDNYMEYLITLDDDFTNIIGAIEYHTEISEISNDEIIFIDFIYIDKRYSDNEYEIKVLQELKNMLNKQIEINCYYNSKIKKICKKIGREVYTKYML